MKKNNSTRDLVNLFFSAFLIIAYIVCSYFFIQYANTIEATSPVVSSLIVSVVFVIFGLLLFYATRVGEGKTIFRFSAVTLILMVLPSLYIVLASIITQLPLGEFVAKTTADGSSNPQHVLTYLCAIAVGYGIPYTFISGFETFQTEESAELLEGGIEEALQEADVEKEAVEEIADEIVVEGIAADQAEDNEKTEVVAEDTVTEVIVEEENTEE